ncbi:hypothetical protein MA16_Dca015079 [Dendrobium catenatum]|uniref:Uncharacterized protein n=1 Tax=Dendrobium catenatum TaxID=906689 RepID=A0A2I0VMA9_9ASPA|nr:hypothetical protein MA16_Dca015079 [Dendrobium catenatum]
MVVSEFCNTSHVLTLHDKEENLNTGLLQHLDGNSDPFVVPVLSGLASLAIQVDDVHN